MDVAFLKYPKQFRRKDALQLTQWTAYSVRHAQKIITISQFSKSEIARLYFIPKDKIAIAYPSVSDPEKLTKGTVRKVMRKFHIESPYFLYVGTLQPRKNLEKLIDAFALVLQEHKASMHRDELPQLVLAGKPGWLTESIHHHIQDSSAKKHIILTGYVNHTEKQALLQDAVAVVQVGLYEGFGIPVLEALKNGKPVVVSDTSSLPEAAGEAGLYVQPDSVDSIAGGLRRALSLTPKEISRIEKLSREHAARFDWQKSAEIVIETVESVVKTLRKP
jgi:glycosyltransferase involved in cell wall biosynthesis